MPATSRIVPVRRAGPLATETGEDAVAVEAPLEVRLHGDPFAVIMRTPGADRDLVAGFLFSEGVIRSAADLARVDPLLEHVVDVRLTDERAAQVPSYVGSRRQVAMNSSCGMCGRRSLESLELDAPPLTATWHVAVAQLAALPDRLRQVQPTFDETGGLHAAGLLSLDGTLEASAEDVGRHNAVDKLIGRMLFAGRTPLGRSILFVSGRSSFEIVQKAFLAGIPLVGAVSAPSSLAIDLATECGITLLGFVRDGRLNVYTHADRVMDAPPESKNRA